MVPGHRKIHLNESALIQILPLADASFWNDLSRKRPKGGIDVTKHSKEARLFNIFSPASGEDSDNPELDEKEPTEDAEVSVSQDLTNVIFKIWAIPGLYFVYFRLFNQTLQFLQQINVKNVHPVHGTGIRTHNLSNMSLHP